MLKIEITIREVPEKKQERHDYSEAFDRMMGYPMDRIDELIASLKADDDWKVRQGRHAE